MKDSQRTLLSQGGEKQAKPQAKRSVSEKLTVASRLRDAQRSLAPARAANKAKRAAGKIAIRIKTS
jgi:hypothetical protein